MRSKQYRIFRLDLAERMAASYARNGWEISLIETDCHDTGRVFYWLGVSQPVGDFIEWYLGAEIEGQSNDK